MRVFVLLFAALITMADFGVAIARNVAPPEIIKLSQSWDQIEGGAKIVVTGKNFIANTRLILGDSEVDNFVIKNSTKIVFHVPGQKTPGGRTLTISNLAGITQCRFDILSKPLANLNGVEINTIAGGISYVGDGQPINSSIVSLSIDRIAIDSSGNIYITDPDNNRVRRLDAASGIITTVAGFGFGAFSGDNGPSVCAGLTPSCLTVDKFGNLFIGDLFNYRVRRVDAKTGIITTVAGNGSFGIRGDGGPAVNAELGMPSGLAIDNNGNLFIADVALGYIRRVDAVTGNISTTAGDGLFVYSGDNIPSNRSGIDPYDIVVDNEGNIFLTDLASNRVRRVDAKTNLMTTVAGNGNFSSDGDGGLATDAGIVPQSLAFDNNGNLLVTDTVFFNVRRVDKVTGIISTIVGDGTTNYPGDGNLATKIGIDPLKIIVDSNNNLLIVDNDALRRVDADTNLVTTIAGRNSAPIGDGGLATRAMLFSPSSVATDSAGNIFILDSGNNRVRKIDGSTGMISTFAGGGDNDDYMSDIGATDALLYFPSSLAVDSVGNLYISEDSYIRKVDAASGVISLFSGSRAHGFFGNNSPSYNAIFSQHIAISIDNQDNLFIADSDNHRVRKIDTLAGIITTLAGNGVPGFSGDNRPAEFAQLNLPVAVSIDNAGNVFIADSANFCIRKIDGSDGKITTVLGTQMSGFSGDDDLAINAEIGTVGSLVVDGEGNLFIADTSNQRIRRVDARTGIVITIAGNGESGFSGDDDLATTANLNSPAGIAIDSAGDLLIADYGNNAIRAVRGVAEEKAPDKRIQKIFLK